MIQSYEGHEELRGALIPKVLKGHIIASHFLSVYLNSLNNKTFFRICLSHLVNHLNSSEKFCFPDKEIFFISRLKLNITLLNPKFCKN